MTEIALVLAPGTNVFFAELAAAFAHELERLGVRCSISRGFLPPEPGRVHALIAPHEHLILSGPGGIPHGLLSRSICISTEQPGTSWFEDTAHVALRAGAAFDINGRGAEILRDRGVRAEYLPLGYTELWDRFEAASAEGAKDLDLVFLGGDTVRRQRLLGSYSAVLARHRCRLQLADNRVPNTEDAEGFVAGEEKLELLARARVLLNLHRTDSPYFEWMRVLEAIHCGAAVVSEHSRDHAPLLPGEHLLVGRAEGLHHLAELLLGDEAERRRIAAAAHEFVREQLPLRASAERLAAAADSLAERPLPSSNRFRRRVRGRPMEPSLGELVSALRRPDISTPALRTGLRRALSEAERLNQRLDLLLARAAGHAEVEHLRRRDPGAEAPRVSVVCVRRADPALGTTLESIAAQTESDWELVVVDDGSADRGREVLGWLEDRPEAPVSLLRHPAPRGLGAARNTGVAEAAGELVLILDAGDELYPPALDRLLSALAEDPGAAFSYGIVERFDHTGTVSLAGRLGFDPGRLVEEPYIDSPALLRRGALSEIGGYEASAEFAGWVDYELWCRLAESGRRGAHAPEILARRPTRESERRRSRLVLPDVHARIAEHCPTLFEGIDFMALERPERGAERAQRVAAGRTGRSR